MKKQLKCYIYTRVSTSMQIDGYSLDAQKSRMKAIRVQTMEGRMQKAREGKWNGGLLRMIFDCF